jgi:hypothetical protein
MSGKSLTTHCPVFALVANDGLKFFYLWIGEEGTENMMGCLPLFSTEDEARAFAIDQAHIIGGCDQIVSVPNDAKLLEFLQFHRKRLGLVTTDPTVLGDDVTCHDINDAIRELEECLKS